MFGHIQLSICNYNNALGDFSLKTKTLFHFHNIVFDISIVTSKI